MAITASPLKRSDTRHILGILNAAGDMLEAAHTAYACGILTPDMMQSVSGVRDDLGRFLAFFEDGAGFGWAKDDALAQMRNLEQVASDLLVAAEGEAMGRPQ